MRPLFASRTLRVLVCIRCAVVLCLVLLSLSRLTSAASLRFTLILPRSQIHRQSDRAATFAIPGLEQFLHLPGRIPVPSCRQTLGRSKHTH